MQASSSTLLDILSAGSGLLNFQNEKIQGTCGDGICNIQTETCDSCNKDCGSCGANLTYYSGYEKKIKKIKKDKKIRNKII